MKNQHNFANFSKVVDYLVDLKSKLNRESMQEIHRRVDELVNAKNLEEKIAEKQSSIIELQCMQCGSTPFKLDESICDDTGIICPFCGCFHGITICQFDEKIGQILQENQLRFQCLECGHQPFSFLEIRKDSWGLQCPHCRYTHRVRLLLEG
jgi:DNA-directed RNA polymerase subunit RPC12/RpoP